MSLVAHQHAVPPLTGLDHILDHGSKTVPHLFVFAISGRIKLNYISVVGFDSDDVFTR
jgi:hypothetical protein